MAGERRRPGVLIISKSEQTRRAFRLALEEDDLEVIATLRSPLFALPALAQRWPDVVVLDRPCAEGLAFLRRLARLRPTPVVVTATPLDGGDELRALAAGALAIVARDGDGDSTSLAAIVRAVAPAPHHFTQASNDTWAWEFAS